MNKPLSLQCAAGDSPTLPYSTSISPSPAQVGLSKLQNRCMAAGVEEMSSFRGTPLPPPPTNPQPLAGPALHPRALSDPFRPQSPPLSLGQKQVRFAQQHKYNLIELFELKDHHGRPLCVEGSTEGFQETASPLGFFSIQIRKTIMASHSWKERCPYTGFCSRHRKRQDCRQEEDAEHGRNQTCPQSHPSRKASPSQSPQPRRAEGSPS